VCYLITFFLGIFFLPFRPLQKNMAALRVQLLGAVRQCTNRGLLYAAKWAAELAVAIDVPPTAAAAAAGHEKADDDDDDDAAFALAKVFTLHCSQPFLQV
jgi:hypothetical protein